MSISLSCVFGKSKNTLLESLKLFFLSIVAGDFLMQKRPNSLLKIFYAPNYFPKNFNDVGDVGKPGGVT